MDKDIIIGFILFISRILAIGSSIINLNGFGATGELVFTFIPHWLLLLVSTCMRLSIESMHTLCITA